ncbi:unnamed protein product [Protopolystoma xenopodis]|uniref:Uncharacterized protein n=1 Tax=Protopolystoma xenopodis TaxID=117903 RepID=A0A3S5CG68_9PLAT|nr:unnamed protein product [Protopolystoma xenopodis]
MRWANSIRRRSAGRDDVAVKWACMTFTQTPNRRPPINPPPYHRSPSFTCSPQFALVSSASAAASPFQPASARLVVRREFKATFASSTIFYYASLSSLSTSSESEPNVQKVTPPPQTCRTGQDRTGQDRTGQHASDCEVAMQLARRRRQGRLCSRWP